MRRALGTIRRGLAALVAAMLLVPTVAVTPAMAAGADFTGGPDVGYMPRVVPNDYTPQAVRFQGSGLEEGEYYVKVRLSPTWPLAGQGSTNRGFIWNKTTNRWVRTRGEDWSAYPKVTVNASGNVVSTNDANWLLFCVGNEATSGQYYLIVSLNKAGVEQDTRNCASPVRVNIVDMKTQGAWVHNGTATGGADFKRITLNEPVASSSTTQVASISRTETNTVDDDGNGIVDDEDWGPAGKTGDYSLAATATATYDVYLQTGRISDDFVMGGADENIAVGAADMVAPSAPADAVATADTTKITVKWKDATDNTAVTGYRVYRWIEDSSSEFTAQHKFVGSTTATSWVDPTAAVGFQYKYEIRSVDASTNVSARSNTTTALIPAVAATVSPALGDGANGWYTSAPRVSIEATTTGYYMWAGDAAFQKYTAPLTAPAGINTLIYYGQSDSGVQTDVKQKTIKVDGAAPAAGVSVPSVSTSASKTKSFGVTWGGTDAAPGSGIATYEVQYKKSATGAWITWRTAAPTTTDATFAGTAGSTYYFRVRAIDNAGNVGAWSAEKSTMVPYDNTSLKYRGTWKKIGSASYYMGSLRRASGAGASASMTFTGGSAAYLVTATGPNRGKVKVYVDGKYKRTVNLYSSKAKSRQSVFLASLKGSGKHTVKLVRVAVKRRPYVAVDGLAVKR